MKLDPNVFNNKLSDVKYINMKIENDNNDNKQIKHKYQISMNIKLYDKFKKFNRDLANNSNNEFNNKTNQMRSSRSWQ